VGRGRFLAQPGAARASARAPTQLRPTAGDSMSTRGDDGVSVGPTHQRERKGGGNGATVDGGVNRPSAGREPGRRWARRRFAANGRVLGQRVGALARGGAGEPRGGLNLARGAGRGAVRGEVAELRDGTRRR
jgi:hypothetical protein